MPKPIESPTTDKHDYTLVAEQATCELVRQGHAVRWEQCS